MGHTSRCTPQELHAHLLSVLFNLTARKSEHQCVLYQHSIACSRAALASSVLTLQSVLGVEYLSFEHVHVLDVNLKSHLHRMPVVCASVDEAVAEQRE